MATDFNNAPTDPDLTPPPSPSQGPTIPWDPNATQPASAQPGQTVPYNPTLPYPGPYVPPGPPTVASPPPAQPPPPAPRQRQGAPGQNMPAVVNPQSARPAPVAPPGPVRQQAPRSPATVPAPIPRAAPRTRPAPSIPVQRARRLLPLPHILLAVGFILLLAALNIPWGTTAGGALIYAQSFPIPFVTDQPDAAAQFAQTIVTAVAMFSLTLAILNYLLMFLNWLARPMRMEGCATALLMPLMIILMIALLAFDGGALVFGAFDPLAGVALAPWQPGFTLIGAHAELGFYAWYLGVILNVAGAFMQPFVRR